MMPKEEKNNFSLRPFHILMAWLCVEMVHSILLVSVQKWYHYLLVLLWLVLLFMMDMLAKKLMRSTAKTWLLELTFVGMVVIFWVLC